MSKEASKAFRQGYSISKSNGLQYDPNVIFGEIEKSQTLKLAQLISATDNNRLLLYKDPKVKELVNYILAAIIFENQHMTPVEDFFPIKISRRYKSNDSLAHKLTQKDIVTDYLGFKITPESEHDIFYSTDPVLQEMIDRRENVRRFVAESFKKLSKTKTTTFENYCMKCIEILDRLRTVFVDRSLDDTKYSDTYATERKEDYERQKLEIYNALDDYQTLHGNEDEELTLDDISEIAKFDIKALLNELQNNMTNEVTLYQLRKNLMHIFENSDLLDGLGVSIAFDQTFHKAKPNGYRSEFIGLVIDIPAAYGEAIELPIECQIQTIEQERDGEVGYSAHIKRAGKKRELKPVPKIEPNKRYSDPHGVLSEYIDFLTFVKNISPAFAEAKTSKNRVEILPKDIYGEYEQILQADDRKQPTSNVYCSSKKALRA